MRSALRRHFGPDGAGDVRKNARRLSVTAFFRIGAAFPLALLLAAGNVLAQPAADLGEWFTAPEKWAEKAEAFMGEAQGLGFRFVDGQQTAMSNQKQALRFLGLEVFEARVYFAADAIRRVELSLYN